MRHMSAPSDLDRTAESRDGPLPLPDGVGTRTRPRSRPDDREFPGGSTCQALASALFLLARAPRPPRQAASASPQSPLQGLYHPNTTRMDSCPSLDSRPSL